MRNQGKSAFTLVEILVVTLISTVVLAAIYSALIVGSRAWAFYSDTIAIKKEARRTLTSLVNELREAENVRIIQSPTQSAVFFYRPSRGETSYTWNSGGEQAGRIIRRNRLDSRVVANNISSLSLRSSDHAVIIEVTAGKMASSGKATSVALSGRTALRFKTAFFNR